MRREKCKKNEKEAGRRKEDEEEQEEVKRVNGNVGRTKLL